MKGLGARRRTSPQGVTFPEVSSYCKTVEELREEEKEAEKAGGEVNADASVATRPRRMRVKVKGPIVGVRIREC